MKELVVISGKGGTGKTSLVASFAALSGNAVLADCDVDASNLHLVLTPSIEKRESFTGGSQARIKQGHCLACGACEELCVFDAIYFDGPGNGRVPKTFRVEPVDCEGCGVCVWFCPHDAIDFSPVISGEWFVSRTRFGMMVHAKLGTAEENSGKLVSVVRAEARRIAERSGRELILVDGAPGVSCPVIASVTGADMVLIVTEPTLSGLHDLERVLQLVKHFQVPSAVCVNKHDINPEVTRNILDVCGKNGVPVAGTIRYSEEITRAMVQGRAVVEEGDTPVSADIRVVHESVLAFLNSGDDTPGGIMFSE